MTTQESSKVCEPTESETFYRQALIKKLEEPNDSIINEQNSERTLLLPDRMMKKFNLSAYLSQLVYPAECTNENAETMLNASIIADHLSSAVNGKRTDHNRSSNHFPNDSVIDEELVLSLSQRCSADETCKWSFYDFQSQIIAIPIFEVNDEDKAFLEVLRKLDANEVDVDDDSILAPFSQKDEKTEVILSQTQQIAMPVAGTLATNGSHTTKPTTTEQHYLDEDDDLLNEFSKNFDDLLPADT